MTIEETAAIAEIITAVAFALPLLGLAGYSPGVRDPGALQALTIAYCVLPCVLKLAASGALWALVIRPATPSSLSKVLP